MPLLLHVLTLCEILNADVVELLDLLHDQLLLVDLDDDGGAACVSAGEPEFAEGILELLGYVDCVRLCSPLVRAMSGTTRETMDIP